MKDKYRIIYKPKGAALEYSPMSLNLYNGCPNGCRYCFVPGVLHIDKETFHSRHDPRKENILDLIEMDLIEMESAGDTRPVLLNFTCDPYPGVDKDNLLTRRVLNIFLDWQHNFQLLTKGGMKASRDFDLYKPGHAYAATLTCDNEKDSQYWEPGAALPTDRISSLFRAHEEGITTWVSFEPVIDPEQVYMLYDATKDYVDLFKIGKLNHQASNIDWRAFGLRIIEMCERDRKAYLIKDALAAYLK
jgi:DNA repair photolyase